jgi:hypothetical protein
MRRQTNKSAFTGGLEHRGGKKLSQHGVEFSRKMREVRKHTNAGFRGRKG